MELLVSAIITCEDICHRTTLEHKKSVGRVGRTNASHFMSTSSFVSSETSAVAHLSLDYSGALIDPPPPPASRTSLVPKPLRHATPRRNSLLTCERLVSLARDKGHGSAVPGHPLFEGGRLALFHLLHLLVLQGPSDSGFHLHSKVAVKG